MNDKNSMTEILNGFANYYYLTTDGKVYNQNRNLFLKENSSHIYTLMTTEGKRKNISLKRLYKLVYNKNFVIDNIKNLDGEEWREIAETNRNYYVSNKGRIKSYLGYYAKLLKPSITKKGYERLQIIQEGKIVNKYVHVLVATAFKEDCGRASAKQ